MSLNITGIIHNLNATNITVDTLHRTCLYTPMDFTPLFAMNIVMTLMYYFKIPEMIFSEASKKRESIQNIISDDYYFKLMLLTNIMGIATSILYPLIWA